MMKQKHEHLISADSRGCAAVNGAQWEITQPKWIREYLNYETTNKIMSIQFSYQNKLRDLTKAQLTTVFQPALDWKKSSLYWSTEIFVVTFLGNFNIKMLLVDADVLVSWKLTMDNY